MNNTMDEYYKVLQYLRETHIDRQYLCEFINENEIETSIPFEISPLYASDFHVSFHFSNIQVDDTIKVVMNTPRDFVDVDTFEILFYSEEAITPYDITVGFSNTRGGVIDNFVVTEEDVIIEESILNNNGFNLFKYRLRSTNTLMQKKNRKISSVYSVNLHFKKLITEMYISNMVVRTTNFNITLEDLDEQIIAGENYIRSQLKLHEKESIPSVLQHLVYKASAAYAFIEYWEYEGKTMDDGTRLGRNYATRLLEQVDRFLERFMDKNPRYFDHINMRLVGYGGINEEKCNHPRQPVWRHPR